MPGISKRRKSPRILVEIKQEHIDRGVKGDSGYCIVSEAVKDAWPDAVLVASDLQTIRFSDSKTKIRYIYLTPRVAQVALVNFDLGIKPEPFTMRLQGAHSLPSRVGKGSPPKSAKPPKGRPALEPGRDDRGDIPERIGGSPPPIGALASGRIGRVIKGQVMSPRGRRREFGLRAFGRPMQDTE